MGEKYVINIATEETAQAILKELKELNTKLESLETGYKSDEMTTINITNIRSAE